MASVGKKLAQNIAAKGRALKPNFPARKPGHSRDELDVDTHFGTNAHRKNNHDTLSANIGVGTPLYKTGKSSSLSSVHSQPPETPLDHEQIVALTHFIRNLSDALAKLKAVFCNTGEMTTEELRVSAHDKLGDVLTILKDVLQRYPALHTTDVLTTAAILITKIKSAHYEEVSADASSLLYVIDQLSLAFSTSVSDYLMGDIDNFPTIGKTKSYDNLAMAEPADDQMVSPEKSSKDSTDDTDKVLQHLEAHAGVDRALLQAKLWAKYVKEVISYVEKKNALENEYSKNLSKLANSLKNSIMKESYLPMQAIFCTAFDQDMDFSAASQATCTMIQSQKFVEPLSARRMDHEKIRKQLKDMWTKELKRMQEAVTNLHKAKANYITRQQELEKARDAALRADGDNQSQSSTAQAKTLEKKRKLEEEAQHKAAEAETTYKALVAEANYRQKSLEKVKCKVLAEVRDLIFHSDQVMKQVTVAYFQMLHTLSAPKPVQFQTLCEASEQYDPGSQYIEYVRRIHVPSDTGSTPEPFVFEQYTPESKMHDVRKPSSHSSGSSNEQQGHVEGSPMTSRDGKHIDTLKVHGEDDTDSISDSSSRSQESSPTASPYQGHRSATLTGSQSLGKLGDGSKEKFDPRLGIVSEQVCMTFLGVKLSPAARTHLFKKLRTLSKCRECESYVYFQGAECELCGLTSHKKCLETLHWECGHKAARGSMSMFGVDFSEHVHDTHSNIPKLLWKCTKEIDERGLDVKGIYRVSGVKSKVEGLCQEFEIDESNVELSEHHPNVIANVLKLYLRQLPEPLMSFEIYPELIKLAKMEQQAGGGQGPASPEILNKLKSLVHQLPEAQFKTCGHLMHHLKRVTEAQDTNQMSAYNLGVVFGPTLLRQSEDAISLDSLLDTPCQTRMIELMILNADNIFGPVEQFMPPGDKDLIDIDGKEVVKEKEQEHQSDGATSEVTDVVVNTPLPGVREVKEALKRSVPEIKRDLVTTEITQPAASPESVSPTPTLLEIATGQSSPKPGDNPPSPVSTTTQDVFVAVKDSHIAAVDLPEPYLTSDSLPDSKATYSITLQYQNLSPPQKASSPMGQKEHLVLDPAFSSGSETSGTNTGSPQRSRKKILTAHVLRSRDNSPSEAAKLPPLTKPKLFTPPQHRRLCRTGTGGLLERPTTPDPFLDDSDDSLNSSLTDMRCISLPGRLPFSPTTWQSEEVRQGAHSPVMMVESEQVYASSYMEQSSGSVSSDKNVNNSNSRSACVDEGIVPSFALSTLSIPLPRMGRRMTYDVSFMHVTSDDQSISSGQGGQHSDGSNKFLTVESYGHLPGRRLSAGTVCPPEGSQTATSPLLGHKLVPKDNTRQPKYV